MEKTPCLKSSNSDVDNEDMVIKIQTLDNIFSLTIKRGSNIQEIKEKIVELTNIPLSKQRLIFQGKLLQNNEKAKNYKISDDSVIHLVAKANEDMQENITNNNANISNNNNNANNLNSGNPSMLPEDIFSSLIEIPIIRPRRPRRRRIPNFDLSECFESMHQNIISVQNLVNCRSKFDDQQILQNRTITGFDFSKSKLEVGQWIDVKDTIDQWLEAQVIKVRGNQAYIHYNGWGTRWDEWLEFSSPRIAHFKTYTTQSPSSIFLSPYPSVICDANIEQQHRSIDSFYYLEKSAGMMQEIIRNIDIMSKLRKKNLNKPLFENKLDNTKGNIKRDDFINEESKSHEIPNTINNKGQINTSFQLSTHDHELLFLSSQMIPLMDRVGRLMSDISLHLSHLIINPNLYPQLLLGYNQNIDMSDTLSCASGFSMYTNEGSIISSITNPNQNQLNPEINFNLQNNNIQLNRQQQTSQNISNNLNDSRNVLNLNSNSLFLNRDNTGNLSFSNRDNINCISNNLINNANANTSTNFTNNNSNRCINKDNSQIINVQNRADNKDKENKAIKENNPFNISFEKEKDKDNREKEREKDNDSSSIRDDDQSHHSENQYIISNEITYNIGNHENNILPINSNNTNEQINTQLNNNNSNELNQLNSNNINNNNINNNIGSQTQNNNLGNTFQNLYNINNASSELPFVQRLFQSQNINNNLNTNNCQAYFDNFPKINLQVPSLLTPGEVILMNGYQNFDEPNIDIYVHTLVAPQSMRNSNNNVINNNNNSNNNYQTGQSNLFTISDPFTNNNNRENNINNYTNENSLNNQSNRMNRSITDYFGSRNSNINQNNNNSRNTSSNNLLNIQNNNPLNQLNQNSNLTNNSNNIITISNRRNRFFNNQGVSTSNNHHSQSANEVRNPINNQNMNSNSNYIDSNNNSDSSVINLNNPFISALNRNPNASLFSLGVNNNNQNNNRQGFNQNFNNQTNSNNTTLIENLTANNNENSSNYENANNNNNLQGGGSIINNLLGNLYSLIANPQGHNRRGSTASDISSTSSTVLRNNLIGNSNNQNSQNFEPTSLQNNGENIGIRSNTNNNNCNNCNLINNSNLNENNSNTNQNNNVFSNSFYKEKATQTDLALNSMITKESNLKDNLMECISNKSERNLSVKYKNTLSYKSVSEVSEFEDPYEEENTDYVIKNASNNNKSIQNTKLNESLHSAVSNFSKDIFEEKDDEKNS